MALHVFIVDDLNRLSDTEKTVLEEITAAKLEEHVAQRAAHLQPNPNAIASAAPARKSGR